ncbi:hypothetical protein C8R44DRAFT_736943 [Mycena epipterygia]|nr:hypothetical protein C8R44DRAFT_736943 [Mycena epipterygia]
MAVEQMRLKMQREVFGFILSTDYWIFQASQLVVGELRLHSGHLSTLTVLRIQQKKSSSSKYGQARFAGVHPAVLGSTDREQGHDGAGLRIEDEPGVALYDYGNRTPPVIWKVLTRCIRPTLIPKLENTWSRTRRRQITLEAGDAGIGGRGIACSACWLRMD